MAGYEFKPLGRVGGAPPPATSKAALPRQPAPAARGPSSNYKAPSIAPGGSRRPTGNWRVDAAADNLNGGESIERGTDAQLRDTYVDKEEAAMRRAMARIMGDDSAKRIGNSYSSVNMSKIAAAKASGKLPQEKPPEPRKKITQTERAVAVPRVGQPQRYSGPFLPHGGKKSEEEIKANEELWQADPAPLLNTAIDREKDKRDLQLRNEFHGFTPEEILAKTQSTQKPAAVLPTGPKQSEEDKLFDQINAEIEERQQFLEEMAALGRRDEVAPRIMAEIAERVNDLQKLDKMRNN